MGVHWLFIHNAFQAYIVALLSYTDMCCKAFMSVVKITITLLSDVIKAEKCHNAYVT